MAWRTQDAALAIVKRQCAADVDPTLDDSEINAILVETAHATIWAASTTYDFGAMVVPTVPSGYVFTPKKRGTSGTTEPDWPTDDRSMGPYDSRWHSQWPAVPWNVLPDITRNDGTLEWVAVEPDFPDIWDVRRATYECWLLKASKVGPQDSGNTLLLQVGDVRKEFSRTLDHKSYCLKMADRYRPLEVA